MHASIRLILCTFLVVSPAYSDPGPDNDYGRSHPGSLTIPWQTLLSGEGLDGWETTASAGEWSRDGDTLIGQLDGKRKPHLYQGSGDWKHYEYSVFVTLEKGSSLQFPFRVSDDRKGFYFVEFDFSWQTVNVTMREPDPGVTKLSVVNYPLEKGREYHLIISARHRSLTTYIDGKLVNQVADPTYARGGVGIAMWWHTLAKYRDPKIRHYKWP